MFGDLEDHNDDNIYQITAQYDRNRSLEIDRESQKTFVFSICKNLVLK